VTEISVKSVANIGSFAGKPYREAKIQVSGTASGGAYSVPAVLAYPSRRSDANGFALVDPYNTVLYKFEGWPGGPFLVPEARRFLGDEYTFGRGNVYIAVLGQDRRRGSQRRLHRRGHGRLRRAARHGRAGPLPAFQPPLLFESSRVATAVVVLSRTERAVSAAAAL
jgi:hypothetical protein